MALVIKQFHQCTPKLVHTIKRVHSLDALHPALGRVPIGGLRNVSLRKRGHKRTFTLKFIGSLKTIQIVSACTCMLTSWIYPSSDSPMVIFSAVSFSVWDAESAAFEARRAGPDNPDAILSDRVRVCRCGFSERPGTSRRTGDRRRSCVHKR